MEDQIKNQFNGSILINPVFKSGDHKIPKFIGIPVFLSDVFIGRVDDLENVHQKLFKDDNLLLLVNGEGGIGKTALAAHYYNKYADQYSHLAWIFAEKSLLDALLTLALPLGVCFPDQSSEDERLDLLLQTMRQLRKPCLLVIDNANDLAELEKYYKALHSCPNFHLLLTTRITEFEQAATYPIEALPDTNAMGLFKKYYQEHLESEDELLRNFLVAVGKNTLIIELLAKNLHNFNQLETCYSLGNLLEDLNKKGLFGVSGKIVSTNWHAKDNFLRKEKPEDIISALYDLSNLEIEERKLLSVFAVLPAENISYTQLKILLPETEQLDTYLLLLAKKGWLGYSKELKSFKVSPIVQETTKAKNTELLNDNQQLITSLLNKLEYEPVTGHYINTTYSEANNFVRYAESILRCKMRVNIYIGMLSARVASYHKTTGNLKKALSFFDYDFKIVSKLCALDPQNISLKKDLAISYSNLGETHFSMGDLKKATAFFENSLQLSKQLHSDNPENSSFKDGLAISHEKLGRIYTELGDLDYALEFFKNENTIYEELHIEFPHNAYYRNMLAISYEKLGETYTHLGKLDIALAYFEKDFQLTKALHEEFPQNVSFKSGLATSCCKLGETYILLGNLDNALVYFEKDMQFTKQLYVAYPENITFKNALAISYTKLGDTHTALQNIDKALTFYQERSHIGIELYEAYPQNVEFKKGLAISYQNIGNSYAMLEKLDEALTFFQKYLQLIKELYEEWPQNISFKRGLAIANSKVGTTQTSLGNWENALTYFEEDSRLQKELYETWPQNVEFKNGLAISYRNFAIFYRNYLGDQKSANTLLLQAEKLWSELAADFPQYIEFSRNLKQVREDLAD
jgi:tetratricopeptide (TPR) repeat protein